MPGEVFPCLEKWIRPFGSQGSYGGQNGFGPKKIYVNAAKNDVHSRRRFHVFQNFSPDFGIRLMQNKDGNRRIKFSQCHGNAS
jgi:hypothetical protein